MKCLLAILLCVTLASGDGGFKFGPIQIGGQQQTKDGNNNKNNPVNNFFNGFAANQEKFGQVAQQVKDLLGGLANGSVDINEVAAKFEKNICNIGLAQVKKAFPQLEDAVKGRTGQLLDRLEAVKSRVPAPLQGQFNDILAKAGLTGNDSAALTQEEVQARVETAVCQMALGQVKHAFPQLEAGLKAASFARKGLNFIGGLNKHRDILAKDGRELWDKAAKGQLKFSDLQQGVALLDKVTDGKMGNLGVISGQLDAAKALKENFDKLASGKINVKDLEQSRALLVKLTNGKIPNLPNLPNLGALSALQDQLEAAQALKGKFENIMTGNIKPQDLDESRALLVKLTGGRLSIPALPNLDTVQARLEEAAALKAQFDKALGQISGGNKAATGDATVTASVTVDATAANDDDGDDDDAQDVLGLNASA